MKYVRKNIILTDSVKKELNTISRKYHVSYSTTINEIVRTFEMFKNNDPLNKYKDSYIEKGNKTSIKLSEYNCKFNYKLNELSNIVTLFFSNEKYDQKQKYKEIVFKNIQKAKDKYYDYNNTCQNMARFIKTHKDYVKKLLKE